MVTTTMPATEKQVSFIQALAGERGVALSAEIMGRLTKSGASVAITRLLAMPKAATAATTVAATTPAAPAVPAGRYAIMTANGAKFYRVDCPVTGKWAGRTFVSIQASDEFHAVKDPSARATILAAIAIDPKAASLLYGTSLGVCGVCGRTLTDEASREAGIGPVCAGKQGW